MSRSSERRRLRAEVFDALAREHGGVVHRRGLAAAGIDRFDVRTEVAAGRWSVHGRHTVASGPLLPEGVATLWRAVWESGSGSVLDGPAALVAHGMTGYRLRTIDVLLPHPNRRRHVEGVRARRGPLPPTVPTGLPRVRIEWATLRAAQRAGSAREAALLVCLPVQQRLVAPDRLLATWTATRRSPRRAVLDELVRDVCDGAHSLGELDFASLCRAHHLPPPTRQSVCRGPLGRVYLDARWDAIGLTVEIDGGHHGLALNPVDDALRQNELTLREGLVLRIPVLGLRLEPDRFMAQVGIGYLRASLTAA